MKRTWMILGCTLALGLGSSACDETPPATDSGIGTDSGGGEDAGTTPGAAIGFGADRMTLTAADYSCRDAVTAPTAGAEVTFDVAAEDFFNGMPVGGLMVQFFPDNVVSLDGTCTGTCQAVTTGADGTASVMAPEGAWYGYRIQAGSGTVAGAPSDYIQVVQYNEVSPAAAGSATLNAVSMSTQNTITALLSVQQQPGNGILTGQLSDCGGENIANANIRIFDSSGEIAFGTGRMDTKPFYFNGMSTPAAREVMTNVDGLYGVANVVIPSDNVVRVELWGSLTDGGAQEMLGCENVAVVADGITVINVGPTRSDGPTGCSG